MERRPLTSREYLVKLVQDQDSTITATFVESMLKGLYHDMDEWDKTAHKAGYVWIEGKVAEVVKHWSLCVPQEALLVAYRPSTNTMIPYIGDKDGVQKYLDDNDISPEGKKVFAATALFLRALYQLRGAHPKYMQTLEGLCKELDISMEALNKFISRQYAACKCKSVHYTQEVRSMSKYMREQFEGHMKNIEALRAIEDFRTMLRNSTIPVNTPITVCSIDLEAAENLMERVREDLFGATPCRAPKTTPVETAKDWIEQYIAESRGGVIGLTL